MHSKEHVDEARRLYATGVTAADIARRMGLPWKTVAHWCRGDRRPAGVDRTVCPRCTGADLDEGRYAYLLGQYLGDGHITTSKRKRNVHRPGKKHTRPIVLGEWQQKIVDTHPGLFLRGLIHSDGCRLTNWATRPVAGELKRYEYPRYFFSNKSLDILALCRAALDRLGIAYRRPGGTRCRSRGGRRSPRSTSGSARRPDVTHIPLLLLDQIAAPS